MTARDLPQPEACKHGGRNRLQGDKKTRAVCVQHVCVGECGLITRGTLSGYARVMHGSFWDEGWSGLHSVCVLWCVGDEAKGVDVLRSINEITQMGVLVGVHCM